MAADDEKQTADDFKEFRASTGTMADALPVIQKNVKTYAAGANQLHGALDSAKKSNLAFAAVVSNQKSNLLKYSAFITDSAQKKQYVDGVGTIADAYDSFPAKVEAQYEAYLASDEGQQTEAALIDKNMDNGWAQFFASSDGKALIQQVMAQYKCDEETAKAMIKQDPQVAAGVRAAVKKQVDAGIKENVEEQVRAAYENNDDLTNGKKALIGAVSQIASGLNDVNEKVNGSSSAIKNTLLPGLKQFNTLVTDKKVDELTGGQKEIAGGIATIASGVLGNSTLKEGVRKAMGNEALVLLRTYSGSSSPAYVDDFASFENQMDKTPGIVAMLLKARAFLGQTIADGTDTYNAGLKKLNAGKAEYAQGLADYAAAPGKLADGEKQLADGEKELADGYKQYEDGKKQLADGKKKLAEYEDGEQQVRDGLATLMATEADPGLESILERRNGDDKFDDANGHLQLDEGLQAVDTGRGYQAESGELITKEVTNRAVGTAAGLGAAALAVLAAILSFLKKNKGAAVSAVLAAVAGGIGAGVGFSAGEYYSDIAGSTIGNTPFIAAAVLAAVAAVFAIVHFTAKPEAK